MREGRREEEGGGMEEGKGDLEGGLQTVQSPSSVANPNVTRPPCRTRLAPRWLLATNPVGCHGDRGLLWVRLRWERVRMRALHRQPRLGAAEPGSRPGGA
jgi:hypothetical protein